MKVYVVEKGSYSDRHVVAICSSEELADKVVELYTDRWDIPYWTEYTVDDMSILSNRLLPYGVLMHYDGETVRVERESIDDFESRTQYYGVDNIMRFTMWAESEAHAIKIANERRIQLIAANIWLDFAARKRLTAQTEETDQVKRIQKYYFPEED